MRLVAPSEIDFELFGDLEFGDRGWGEAELKYGLTREQIGDRLLKVRRVLVDQGARMLWGVPPRCAGYFACHHAIEQFCRLEKLALEAWEESRGSQTVVRTVNGQQRSTTYHSHGEPKYLRVALQMVKEQVRLSAEASRIFQELAEEGAMTPPVELTGLQFAPDAPRSTARVTADILLTRHRLNELYEELKARSEPETKADAPAEENPPEEVIEEAQVAAQGEKTPCTREADLEDDGDEAPLPVARVKDDGEIDYDEILARMQAHGEAQHDSRTPVRAQERRRQAKGKRKESARPNQPR